jgi:hypothetical protein
MTFVVDVNLPLHVLTRLARTTSASLSYPDHCGRNIDMAVVVAVDIGHISMPYSC